MLGLRSALFGCLVLASLLTACGGDDDDDDAAAGGSGGTKAQGGSTSKAGSTSKGGSTSGGQPGGGEPTTSGDTFGEPHEGVYHLGPVDFEETQWHNACAPAEKYRPALRDGAGLGGEFLAGVSNKYNDGGGVCDACILIETAMGKSIIARVVTYGVEHADGDIDVSPAVYDAIHQGEFPRTQTWRFARCPEAGPLQYEFQTMASEYWSSLWVRNPRVPLTKLEVKSANHPDFFTLARASDGTLNDAGGFGAGPFTFRLTGMDGQVVTDELPGFKPGELVKSTKQFE